MFDLLENVFEYNLTTSEQEVLGLTDYDETSYLLLTDSKQILSDLHLLFVLRKDSENRNRILKVIDSCKEMA